MTSALAYLQERHLRFTPMDFQPVARGALYPGWPDIHQLTEEELAQTPYLLKVRHRGPGPNGKHGVVRAFATINDVETAVESLRNLHFAVEFMAFDLRQERDQRERKLVALEEQDEWSLKAELEWAQQQPPTQPVGPFPYGMWTTVVPSAPAATT